MTTHTIIQGMNLIMQRDAHLIADELAAVGGSLDIYRVKCFLAKEELLPILGGCNGMIAGDGRLTARLLEAGLAQITLISKWEGRSRLDLPGGPKAARHRCVQFAGCVRL